MSLKRVLSIQSHVVSGYVGNKSAVFPLHLHGFKVDAINSVQLSNHTQYPNVAGQILKDKDVWEIYEALKKNGINKYSHITTGYVGDPTFLRTVVAVVNDLKTANPDIVYVCDPVMGDNGKFYVPESMLSVYREEILPIADVLLPNQFEAEQLSGMKIDNEEDGWKVCDWFHKQGNLSTVIITSGDIGSDPDRMLCLASIRKGTQRIRMEIPRIPASFTGSGDLFSASYLIWSYIKSEDAKLALEQTVNTVYAVLVKTFDNFKDMKVEDVTSFDKELRIIESKGVIESPPTELKAEVVL